MPIVDGEFDPMHSKSNRSILEVHGLAVTVHYGPRSLGISLTSLYAFFVTLSVVSMLGCVSIDTTTRASVWSFDKTTRIQVLVPTKNTQFNIHSVGWVTASDEYDLTIPRGRESASADEIELRKNAKGRDSQLFVGRDSVVKILGSAECTVVLKLFDERGQEYKFNGSYTDQLCRR